MLAPLFKMLEACFDLLVPLVVAAIIDTGIEAHDTGYIIRMCGILIVLALVGLLCSITAQFFAAKAAVGFAAPKGCQEIDMDDVFERFSICDPYRYFIQLV